MKRTLISSAYMASLLLMVFIGLQYDNLSSGLASYTSQGPFFCNELLSSGGDDSAMVFAFVLFSIPLLLRAARWKRPANKLEVAIFGACLACTCLALFLATLDCASIFYTAFVVPDFYLVSALIALPLSTFALALLWACSRPTGVEN